jgi:Ser/Thr protein kinase RdoA (MazF antagonist)
MQSAINSLLAKYGLDLKRVRLIERLDCEIYRINTQSNGHGESDLSLRIYPPYKQDTAPIRAEVEWLRTLSEEGLHVPLPLSDQQGNFVQKWQPIRSDTPRHAVLLTWLPGRMLDKGLTPKRLHRIGNMMGHMHRTSARLTSTGVISTPRLAYTSDLKRWAQGSRPRLNVLSARQQTLAKDASQRLIMDIDGFSKDAASFGFVHGDLHHWNILFTGAVAGAIDFSDCGWGHHALDLASTLQYLKFPLANNHDHRWEYSRLYDALLQGYAEERPLPSGVDQQIDTYIIARMFMTMDWILDDWPQLDHRPWGPGFLLGSQKVLSDYLAS